MFTNLTVSLINYNNLVFKIVAKILLLFPLVLHDITVI